ncbi:mpv17-like protein [Teleopsis dalmanni]|uniref:mpv17-like protein n=1 Tax=Teleopsis dalmanni TaxID=139649 RepID=UPI0018CE7837|nr:mpv17-like protein [Teleopsis dalmanni]
MLKAISIFNRINTQLKPYALEGTRCFVLMGVGDVIAQKFIEKKSLTEVDVVRTMKFASIGFFFIGPVLKYWYRAVDSMVSQNQHQTKRALKKMLIDQSCCAPVFPVAIMGILGTMNGTGVEDFKSRVKADYFQIMKNNYTIWPAAQMINFAFVPMHLQVVFVQLVAIGWNCYISLVVNKNAAKATKEAI